MKNGLNTIRNYKVDTIYQKVGYAINHFDQKVGCAIYQKVGYKGIDNLVIG